MSDTNIIPNLHPLRSVKDFKEFIVNFPQMWDDLVTAIRLIKQVLSGMNTDIELLPDQAGKSGKVLKTNGQKASWSTDLTGSSGSTPAAHSSTHENGGSDEINLAGLSGSPADLTTHEADLSAHTNTTRVTTTYTTLATDEVIYGDTDGGTFTITLLAGVNKKKLRLINCGSSGNDLTITSPDNMFGSSSDITLIDGEVLDLVFETTEEWW